MPLVGAVAVLAHSTGWFSAFGGTPHGHRLQRMKRASSYSEGRFSNPPPAVQPSAWERAERAFASVVAGLSAPPEGAAVPVELAPASLAERPASGLRVTWLGHATVLVEIDGVRVLTDPVWSPRASPSTLVGSVRLHAPPLQLDRIPRLDAVVISHDHYDHLDQRSVVGIAATGVKIIVPLGVGAHLERWGIPAVQVRELDWWEEERVGSTPVVVAATPARHFSGRGLLDGAATAWASWALRGPRHGVFFSGATGLFDGLDEIGETFGPFDVTLLDVGAGCAGGAGDHLGPAGAIAAHQRLRGRRMIPIRWGTYADAEPWYAAVDRLTDAAAGAPVQVAVLRPGQSLEPGARVGAERWWRSH